jgi:uncharacterized protein
MYIQYLQWTSSTRFTIRPLNGLPRRRRRISASTGSPGGWHFSAHPQREFGGLAFGPASLVDVPDLLRQWFDFTLGTAPRPAFLAKRVAYYVAGAEEWRYAESLDELNQATKRLFLASDDEAGDLFHSGRLASEPKPTSATDHWTYDPLDTRPEELDREPVDAWATSQRYAGVTDRV